MPNQTAIQRILERTNEIVKGLDLEAATISREAKMRIACSLILAQGISEAVADVGPAIKQVAEDLRGLTRAIPGREDLLGIETALRGLKG